MGWYLHKKLQNRLEATEETPGSFIAVPWGFGCFPETPNELYMSVKRYNVALSKINKI